MSGGICAWTGEGEKPVNACGMISADFSTQKAWTDHSVPGCSVVSMLWPAMGMRTNISKGKDEEPNPALLHDLVVRGFVEDVAAEHSNISVELLDEDQVRVIYGGKLGANQEGS